MKTALGQSSVAAEVAAKATPRPWQICHVDQGELQVVDKTWLRKIAVMPWHQTDTCQDEDDANAELIVTAVNSFDSSQATIRQLTEAIEGMLGASKTLITATRPFLDAKRKAEAVLAEVAQ